jgi:hypothetical protein
MTPCSSKTKSRFWCRSISCSRACKNLGPIIRVPHARKPGCRVRGHTVSVIADCLGQGLCQDSARLGLGGPPVRRLISDLAASTGPPVFQSGQRVAAMRYQGSPCGRRNGAASSRTEPFSHNGWPPVIQKPKAASLRLALPTGKRKPFGNSNCRSRGGIIVVEEVVAGRHR